MSLKLKRVWNIYDLHPDEVQIIVDWDRMVIGSSIFVPCINTTAAVKQARAVAKVNSWAFEYRIRIEDGKLGVRVWRTA